MRNFLLGFMYYLHKPKSIQTIQHLFGSGIFDVVGSGTLFLTNGQTSPIVTIAPGKSNYFKADMANMNHLCSLVTREVDSISAHLLVGRILNGIISGLKQLNHLCDATVGEGLIDAFRFSFASNMPSPKSGRDLFANSTTLNFDGMSDTFTIGEDTFLTPRNRRI